MSKLKQKNKAILDEKEKSALESIKKLMVELHAVAKETYQEIEKIKDDPDIDKIQKKIEERDKLRDEKLDKMDEIKESHEKLKNDKMKEEQEVEKEIKDEEFT